MKRFYILALVAMMFAACTTDETQDLRPVDAPETLTVGFEEDTRIQLNSAGKTVWTKDDLVSVFYRSDANQKWQFQGETGERIGNLKRVSAGSATETMKRVVVVYPYNENYYINTDTYNVQAFLPATQHYLADSYGLDGNIMISVGEYNQFSLKNVCGWLKLQLTGAGEKIKRITINGNNGEQVAGEIYINSADATAILAAENGTADDSENGAGGSLIFDDTILTKVKLDCGNGVTLGTEPTAFYIALPPQTFEKGVTVKFADVSGKTMIKSTDKSLTIERNTIQPMAVFEVDAESFDPPSQIWYTNGSTTEATAPYKTDVFGADIISNLYDTEKECWVITFDGDVTSIGEDAFRDCTSLISVTIPDSVTSIGSYAFYGCSSLTRVDITDLLAWCKISFGDFSANPLRNGAKLYINNTEATNITIPSDITEIKNHVFDGCTSLTSVTIPDSVTEIGGYAFNKCTSLTRVTIPDSVNEIGEGAFNYCSSLTSINIPDSVTSIGISAFYKCTSLTRVDITDLSAWCKISFGNMSSTNPLCNGAKLYINNTEATDIIIPSDITEIKNYAFDGCTSLTRVTIPDSVTSIGYAAFRDCTSLQEVYCKPTIPPTARFFSYYEWYAFGNNALGRKIYVPASDDDSIINAYKTAQCWSEYESDIYEYNFIPNNEIWYTNGSTTEATIPNDTNVFGANIVSNLYDAEKEHWVITFDGDVTKIGDRAFSGYYNEYSTDCRKITSITIPDSVTSIGGSAFYYCTSLTSVNIPDSVTSIGRDAFSGCKWLTSITIPDSVTSIGERAFPNCSSLKEVYCKATTPPTGGSSMFSNNASDRKIYVPASDDDSIINSYKAKQYWSSYASYIEEYDFSAGQ